MTSPLDRAQRARFARHLMLPDVGPDGQARLLASVCRVPAGAPELARTTCAMFLDRAGVRVEDTPTARSVDIPSWADDAAHDESAAAAFVAGAFAAVEAAKALLGGPPTAPRVDLSVLRRQEEP